MQAEVFLDTEYAIASSSPKDQCHDRAMSCALALRLKEHAW